MKHDPALMMAFQRSSRVFFFHPLIEGQEREREREREALTAGLSAKLQRVCVLQRECRSVFMVAYFFPFNLSPLAAICSLMVADYYCILMHSEIDLGLS